MKYKLSFFIIFLSLLFLSCQKENDNRIYLNSNWQYSTEGASGPFYDIQQRDFSSLPKFLETRKGYIWLKTNFTVPQNLQEKTLSLFLGVTKIADKVYINNTYIGKSGFFPPEEFTSGEISTAYQISPIILDYENDNELLITLWVNGKGCITQEPFIGTEIDINAHKTRSDYLNSTIFLLLSAVLIVISFIYFFLYILRPVDRSNLSFSRLTFLSALYLTTVCLGEYSLIFQGKYSLLLFEKIFSGIISILTANYAVSFIRDFLGKKDTKSATIFRKFIVFFAIFLVFFGEELAQFYIILNIAYILVVIHIGYAVLLIVKSIKENNKRVPVLLAGFSPVLISLLVMCIYFAFKHTFTMLIVVIGWQLTIMIFLTILIYKFSKTQSNYENLNRNLEKLISDRTLELTQTNRKLAEINSKLKTENDRAEKEITLAANVQKNFFIHDFTSDDKWEVAYFSQALAGVSGDFYDFYTSDTKSELKGLGIFDVSGHGLASGLVTMLVKNIINQEFIKGKNKKLKDIVSRINERVLNEKGNIENYLTGILCRIDSDSIELVNAGHPAPLLYNNNTKTISELNYKTETRCGVIGILGLPAIFDSISIDVNSGDEFLFFTDGIVEATNEKSVPFGKSGLQNSFENSINKNISEQVSLIIDDMKNHVKKNKIEDDITVIILRRK